MMFPLLVLPVLSALAGERIKHFVVVYQENRAFDHMFGWDKSLSVDGLTGNETNPIKPSDPAHGSVKVFVHHMTRTRVLGSEPRRPFCAP